MRPAGGPDTEPRPPRRRGLRPARNRFFRRRGWLFAVVNLVGIAIFIAVVILVLNALGLAHISMDQFQWVLPLGGIFLALIITLFVLAGTNLRRMSMPLDDLLAASNRLADGDYATRVEESGPPEVRSLTRAFNSMAERLQVNDQQRRAMLADVSHELRTPLTVIQGNLEGVLDGLYPADEARLKSILEETQILSRLIDDLRTLALAESGALQLRLESTDLANLVREMVGAFRSQADEGGVKMELSLPESDLSLELDPERIRQVLTNLIANALRYSPRGGSIRIGLTESGQGPGRGALLSVEDSGPGIAAADLPHVFERFYKSADSRGMGLGLSIAKYIVEAHGGEIKAESSPGRGTKISFSLPIS